METYEGLTFTLADHHNTELLQWSSLRRLKCMLNHVPCQQFELSGEGGRSLFFRGQKPGLLYSLRLRLDILLAVPPFNKEDAYL